MNPPIIFISVVRNFEMYDRLVRDNPNNAGPTFWIGAGDSPANGCHVVVGKNTTANGLEMRLMEDGSSITIGECRYGAWNMVLLKATCTQVLLPAQDKEER